MYTSVLRMRVTKDQGPLSKLQSPLSLFFSCYLFLFPSSSLLLEGEYRIYPGVSRVVHNSKQALLEIFPYAEGTGVQTKVLDLGDSISLLLETYFRPSVTVCPKVSLGRGHFFLYSCKMERMKTHFEADSVVSSCNSQNANDEFHVELR